MYRLVFVGIFFCQIVMIRATCVEVNGQKEGFISDREPREFMHRSVYNRYSKCWKIEVSAHQFIRLYLESLSLPGDANNCREELLEIKIGESDEKYNFCTSQSNPSPVPITALTNVTVRFATITYTGRQEKDFNLKYKIQDIECTNKESFRCTPYSCVPKEEVCDGVKDCENGNDENNCATGISSITGIKDARLRAINWLKNKRSSSWGWRDNTPRAITALYLAEAAHFNGTSLEEDLMAKQTELKTAIALLKNPISNEQLSMFINALLVTCHSPRHFYGQDLIKRLKDQLELTDSSIHPVAYLALCNANETWPLAANTHLDKILNSDSEYSFVTDIQAFAVMAISCHENRTKTSIRTENSSLKSQYQRTIKHFKQLQLQDGSFGNVHTTALVTQALLSSGQEHAKDWKLNSTLKFLMEKLNSDKEDFVSYYLTLPVLNGRSMSDVYRVNCSGNLRTYKEVNSDNLASDTSDYNGPKMRVQYSLFVGEEKDIIHTISLRVRENITAYQVMQLAEVEDPKYKFDWKRISDRIYVFKISKWINDSESGMFWLLYLGWTNSTDSLKHRTTSFSGNAVDFRLILLSVIGSFVGMGKAHFLVII